MEGNSDSYSGVVINKNTFNEVYLPYKFASGLEWNGDLIKKD